MGLCTGSAATWGATQQAYQFVSSVTAAYTEVTSGGYARVCLAGITLTKNTDSNVWTCTSPVTFRVVDHAVAASRVRLHDAHRVCGRFLSGDRDHRLRRDGLLVFRAVDVHRGPR